MQGMREMSNAKEGTSTVALIKFASYNIHLGIGRDGMFAPHRVAAVIGELEADVIALQEVEFGAGDFDMFLHGSVVDADPDDGHWNIFYSEGPWNTYGYKSEEADTLLEKTRRTSDQAERA